jgi:hypothetical protein
MRGEVLAAGVALALCVSGCAQTTEASTSTSEQGPGAEAQAPTSTEKGTERECGETITVNDHASCPFAKAVYAAVASRYRSEQAVPGEVSASSPVTHKTYEVACRELPGDTNVECTTGDAEMVFAISRLKEEPAPPAETSPEPEGEGEEDEVGSFSHATDGQFCKEHECEGNFTGEDGTIAECFDGTFSHAGGISGACSDHGGEAVKE